VKPVAWLDDSLECLRAFPPAARTDAGYQLERVQRGEEPKHWRPMPSIGPGVSEIKVRAEGAFRVVYVAKFAEAIYVLHAFQKKSRKTAWSDIDLSRRRYTALMARRRQE
jgi:phage-related protein